MILLRLGLGDFLAAIISIGVKIARETSLFFEITLVNPFGFFPLFLISETTALIADIRQFVAGHF
jgi:hypothetical protein